MPKGVARGGGSRVEQRRAISSIPPGWVAHGDLLPVVSLRSTTGYELESLRDGEYLWFPRCGSASLSMKGGNMTRRKALAIIVSLLVLVAYSVLVRWQHATAPVNPAMIITAQEITTPEDLERFLGSKKAVLHIDVGWAIQAVLSRPIVLQMREEIEHDVRFEDVIFRRIDMTEQEANPLWNVMMKWLKANGEWHDPVISGCGAILWIKDGKLSSWVIYPKVAGIEKLRSRTRETF